MNQLHKSIFKSKIATTRKSKIATTRKSKIATTRNVYGGIKSVSYSSTPLGPDSKTKDFNNPSKSIKNDFNSSSNLNDFNSSSNFKVGIMLKRNPLVAPELSALEQNYTLFKEMQIENEKKKFYQEFYYKRGSLNEKRFIDAQKTAQSKLTVQPAEPELLEWEQQMNEAKVEDKQVEELNKDQKSLDRVPEKSVYLLVKQGEKWKLPDGPLEGNDLLHEAAPKVLDELAGSKLDTWFVGKVPSGHFKESNSTTFYMKAHIMAGRVLFAKSSGISDHAWTTKEEAKTLLEPTYYNQVSKMMSLI